MIKRALWRWLAGLLAVGLAACAPGAGSPLAQERIDSTMTPVTRAAALKDYGPAPELANEVWLNTDPDSSPLRLADLRGKVVLIDMWTFG